MIKRWHFISKRSQINFTMKLWKEPLDVVRCHKSDRLCFSHLSHLVGCWIEPRSRFTRASLLLGGRCVCFCVRASCNFLYISIRTWSAVFHHQLFGFADTELHMIVALHRSFLFKKCRQQVFHWKCKNTAECVSHNIKKVFACNSAFRLYPMLLYGANIFLLYTFMEKIFFLYEYHSKAKPPFWNRCDIISAQKRPEGKTSPTVNSMKSN